MRPVAAAPVESAPRYMHRVSAGETLAAIATRYQVASRDLAAENQLDPDVRLEPGIELRIPADGRLIHHVQPGETLSHLAVWYRIPARALARANRIEDPRRLRAGMEMRIPPAAARVPIPPPERRAGDDAPDTATLQVARALLAEGETRYREADFSAALHHAQRAQRRAATAPPDDPRDAVLARAALLEGMAQTALGLGGAARSSFGRALRLDTDLALDPRSTSPKILRVFEAAQRELDS